MSNKNSIFLVGLPGVGKTTLGKKLAHKLGYSFYDSDREIINVTGASISIIFDIEGESGFRLREAKIIDKLSNIKNIVLATGGGSVLNNKTRDILKKRGIVVFLNIDYKVLINRSVVNKGRPLLKDVNIEKKYKSLYKERHDLYKSIADIEVVLDNLSIDKSVKILYDSVKKFIGNSNA